MIKAQHLRDYVIRPTLGILEAYDRKMNTPDAEMILLATGAHESHMGTYLVQEGGPALGLNQIELNTHNDVINKFVLFRPKLAHILDTIIAPYPNNNIRNNLVANLIYNTAIARIIYWRAPESMPHRDDVHGLARYWKKYYNTYLGKGSEQQFIDDYNTYIHGNIYD